MSYATRRDAEGQKIDNLPTITRADVESTLKAVQEAKRRAQRPIELKRRDGISEPVKRSLQPMKMNRTRMRHLCRRVGVQPPALPALPPPNSEQERNTKPRPQTPDYSPQSSANSSSAVLDLQTRTAAQSSRSEIEINKRR